MEITRLVIIIIFITFIIGEIWLIFIKTISDHESIEYQYDYDNGGQIGKCYILCLYFIISD